MPPRRALYHCSYCMRDITATVRVRCAECTDVDFCVDCFAAGVEPHPHRSNHAFRVIDRTMSCPLFSPVWGADEELLLLEGLESFGVANWAAVAEHVGSKGALECRDHYFEVYLDHPAAPLPRALPSMAGVDLTSPVRAMDGHTHAAGIFECVGWREGFVPGHSVAHHVLICLYCLYCFSPHHCSEDEPPVATPPPPEDRTIGGGAGPSRGAGRGRGRFAGVPGHAPGAGAGAGAGPADMPAGAEGDTGQRGGKGVRGGRPGAVPGASPRADVGGKHPVNPGLTLRLPTSSALQAGEAPGAVNTVEVTGFHSKRGEFDPEWDNEAEVPLAELDFRLPGNGAEEELPVEAELKQRLVQIYNSRLDERDRRRAFLVDRGLLNVRRLQAMERRRPPEELQLLAQLRPFARHCASSAAHEALCEGLLVELQLRQRIEELHELRGLGMRTMQEAEAFVMERARRGGEARPGPTASVPVFASMGLPGGPTAQGGAGAGPGRARAVGLAVLEDLDTMRGVPLAPLEAGKGTREARKLIAATAETFDCAPRPPAVTNWRLEAGGGANLVAEDLPGSSLLTAAERAACASLRLLPPHVAHLRAVLEEEARARGRVSRADAPGLVRLDRVRAAKLMELLHDDLDQQPQGGAGINA